MITIRSLTNGRRGQSVQPETTAIDLRSGRPTKLTVLTQKLPFILGSLRVLNLTSPCASRARAQFANFNNEVAPWSWTVVCMFQIKCGDPYSSLRLCSHVRPARAGPMRGPSRGQRGAALTSRHQLPYALMYEDNPDS